MVCTRLSPIASVSSVSGWGANQPPPAETRALSAWPECASNDSRGVQIVP